MKNTNIAIVGMDCRYPGAHSVSEYWENILALRQQFRKIPDQRLNLLYYGSDDASSVDTTYCKKAAVLQGYNFDRVKYRISKSTFEQTDMAHWLALDVAAGALRDAGFEEGNGLNKEKIGVIIGNSLNGEFTRANLMRLRWPYVFKAFESTLYSLDYSKSQIAEILGRAEKVYKDPFPVPDADTLAGGLSNTLAGRVCNYFNFNGGGYTIDGACSSSLLALVNGCNAVAKGDMDVALVGGVDLSIDPFELIGFSRNGALAPDKMEVLSGRSQGFWPGEGCGIVVLMREEEAIAKGLNIYSVIKGWGISSDGKGGITRPKAETQQLALQRAYESAGYPISSVNIFEAHGTGTPIGDKIELTALVNELKLADTLAANTPVVSSVKHLIGHTKAAAGIAGLIKASLAIKNRIIPGGIGTSETHPVLAENTDVLHLSKAVQLYKEDDPMRASVSSFGFGGINVHITMEENDQSGFKPKRLPTKIKALASSYRDAEVFPLATNSKEALLDTIEQLINKARDISIAEFIDLSASLISNLKKAGNWKASIVANTPDQLLEQCLVLQQNIVEGATEYTDVENGVFFNATGKTGKIAFLFPGQGAPMYKNWGIFEQLNKELFNEDITPDANGSSDKGAINDTSVAQPAIVKNNLQALALLNNLGVDADWGIGHSLGEITGFAWANSVDQDTAIELAQQRGELMSKYGEEGGTLLAVKAPLSTLQPLVTSLSLTITGYNGTDSFVVGGAIRDIKRLEQNAFELGLQHTRLKVSHAFHTPMMQQAATAFKAVLAANTFNAPRKQLLSTVTGTFFKAETDIEQHLYEQIERPVKFIQAVQTIQSETSFFIETGPGRTLSKTLGQEADNVIAIDFGSSSIEGLLKALSACFIVGQDVQFEELNFNRFHKDFDLNNWTLNVLESPCEQLDHDTTLESILNKSNAQTTSDNTLAPKTADASDTSEKGILRFIKELISTRTEIPVETIYDEDRIMSQLHLNSLTITEIVSAVAKNFNKSHKVFSEASILANADGSLKALAELIYKGEDGNAKRKETNSVNFEGLENWTHIFQRKAVTKDISKIHLDRGQGKISVQGCERETLRLKEKLKETRLKIGNGSVFVYNTKDAQDVLYAFLYFLQQESVQQSDFICLVNVVSDKITGDLKPVLRSFQQEYPNIQTFSLDVDADLYDKEERIIEELKTCTKYKEISYTAEGERRESEFTTFFPKAGALSDALNQEDVILATGGGKGITYESILALGVATKAKLAILGRSTPESNSELRENLARLDEQGITYKYYAADVCDKAAIQAAVQEIRTDLGAISVIVHGAGINNPKLISALQEEDFKRTETVKVQGLRNVLDSLEEQSYASDLQLLIGYGSIIAQSGMQGNADYAWSNDQLARTLDDYSRQNPNCRSITLEWSVWQGTGMGENLNSIENLKNQGVWPIPIDQGIEALKATIADPTCAGRLVVSGRFGKIPTLIYNKQRLPIGRFIMNLKYHVPNVEAVCDVGINIKDDVYLQHHVFDGQYVFPTVMILEGMAQVCSVLYPDAKNWSFKDLQINRSIFIPKNKANTVRFIVSRVSEKQFKAVVRSEDSDFELSCFEATIDFSESLEYSKVSPIESANLQELNLNIDDDFYDNLLFHSGPFRRIKSFYRIHALESMARATSNTNDQWFDAFISERKLLGDPGLNDAAIHCHQACRPAQQLLPTGATEIYFNPSIVEGPFFIKTEELKEEGNNTTINVYVVNGKGEIKSVWKNLVLTQVTGKACNRNWIPELLVPYIEYQLIHNSSDRGVKLSLEDCQNMLNDLSNQTTSKSCQIDKFSISLQKQEAEATSDNDSNPLLVKGLEETVVLQIQHD